MKKFLCLILCLVLCLGLAACKDKKAKQATGDTAVYTVCVLGQNDTPLANVGVFVYEDQSQKELVWYEVTDENGKMTFEDVQRDTYVAVLSEVPVGYAVEESYSLTGLETTIRLQTGTMTDDMDITYKLGDMVMDFTVTDTEGNEWSLKELLQTKKAVVLNFYYNGCVPCQMEFPHLQEAYLDYADQVAVIAMNPVDNNDAVAAFKAEYGLTFPMAAVSNKWEQFMQISAYPKTVVIDRLGNIVLMHTGSVDSAQTFRDVFAAVSAEEYEQVIYQSLAEVPVSAEEGSLENPALMGPTPSFELTIGAGKEHYIEFLRLNNLTLRIKDPDAYVIYNDKTYKPENGVISLLVNSPDMNTPVLIGFGNSGETEKTFTVTMSSQPGTVDNPYTLKEGDNQVRVSAGNEQGVYYVWTAKENGSLRVWCTSATAGVKYDCVLYNLNSYAQRNLANDSQAGELGQQYVEVLVNKGDKVQMIAAVLPDETWNYPAGNFIYMVEFLPGPGRDQDKMEKTIYTITVTDDKEQPLANVNFQTVVEEVATNVATNAEGIAQIELPTGEYKFTMILPEGYTSEITEFTLNKETPEYTMVLTEKVVVMVDYTVNVTDPYGEPVVGATVIIGDKFAVTDENGQAVINLEEGEYTVQVSAPEGYVISQDSYSFPEGETVLLVDAEYVLGSEKNPVDLTEDLLSQEDFIATVTVPAGTTTYYCAYRVGGMFMSINGSEGVLCEVAGVLAPYVWTITNDGDAEQSYTVTVNYPVGHYMNPMVLDSLGNLQTSLEANDSDGFYYAWTAQEEGFITFYLTSVTDGVVGDIVLTNTTNSAIRSLSEDGEGGLVTLNVAAGDMVTIQIMASANDMGGNLAIDIASVGSFTAQENTEDAKITYSVVVKDEAGAPMEGISVAIGNSQLITDANGLAFAQLVEGTYTATVTVPEGYKAQQTQFSLSVLEAQANVTLTQLKEVDYTISLQLDGAAYTGSVKVEILQGATVAYETTTTTGSVTAKLLEGDYTVKLTLDNNLYGYDAAVAVLSEKVTDLTIALQKLTTYTDYTVTVTDYSGKLYSGVFVQIMKGSQVVASGTTDSNGKIAKNLETGEYTVKLTFSGTSYYYNAQTATLTGVAPNLKIQLADEVDPNNVYSHWIINDQNMYVLTEGATHIQVGAGKPYYTTELGYPDCLFVFQPTRDGMFRISIDQPGVELRNYGSSPYFLFIADTASGNEDNALPYEVKKPENSLIFLGVEVVEGVTDLCITITRVGEPGFDIESVPYSTDWQTGYTPVKQTVKVPSGQSINYVDIKAATAAYTIVYSQKDGFYHVGSVDGPVLYLNLGTVTKQYISFNEIINGTSEGAGGSPVRRYFFDETGAFVKKEDYTDVLSGYISCADTTYGLYPVTQELAYILQTAKPGWWDSTSPDYILTDCNPDLGWLFACCYIQ